MSVILAFAGSNSSTSINYALVKYTASLLEDHDLRLLNMSNYPFPLFSEDAEKEDGYSNSLKELYSDIQEADGLIISVNEHNGGQSAYFKNLVDWLSRLDRGFVKDAKILLMSTSPGKRGAIGSLERTEKMMTRFGAEITATFSLPSFKENFDMEEGITDQELAAQHQQVLKQFLSKI
ncbi:NADPH-dependent FMN reductase [Zeaxanthinibacter enoshimensis]|uniref:NAD(P)H-dependent FMN reductase n=1 Tax=Zeaxanthinibacter enoshimensis TaxID=392009 RepID=A0A4V3D3T7_9FLAO|nr:NAD(P)H-dependent oxidoreductase [Zeaxanthinibacter enoshimensis]TDQ31273.1 NAD(P)H-dependent FMN reductase [Zeaxanthinibacter enoshimensis]